MRIKIGERLIRAGVVSEKQIDEALARQRAQGGRLGDNLLELGFLDEETLHRFVHHVPAKPADLKETGLPRAMLEELVLKLAFYQTEFTPTEISELIKLPPSLVIELITTLRREGYMQARGGDSYLVSSVHHTLTEGGRTRAHELLGQSSYAGPAPVPITDYIETVWHQTIHSTVADEPVVRNGFKNLVLRHELFNQLGPAINSGRSIFLYGPPGTGKTSVSQGIADLFQDEIFIPHSVYAHGQIIQVFYPINHDPLENEEASWDRRWCRARRPSVTVGGELSLDMLELNLVPLSNYYDAPLQLKANNGLLIIDDLGRQRIATRDLLNRWIIPLETAQEHLTLATGQKITVPFDVLVIFCTNIAPTELVDEAFLRRIRHKIKLDHVSRDEFVEILKINCDRSHIRFEPEVVGYLLEMYYRQQSRPFVAVHARDIVDHIVDYARYRRTEPVLTKETIDVACSTYFVEGY